MDDLRTPLEQLVQAAHQREIARGRYRDAVQQCKEAGISNRKMAKELGISETAIRLYIKRNAL